MAKTESEKQRLRERIRNIDSLIRELENKSDRSSQEELRRQRELKAGIERELNS